MSPPYDSKALSFSRLNKLRLFLPVLILSLAQNTLSKAVECRGLFRTVQVRDGDGWIWPHLKDGKPWFPPSSPQTETIGRELHDFLSKVVVGSFGGKPQFLSSAKAPTIGIIAGKKDGVDVFVIAFSGDAAKLREFVFPHIAAAQRTGRFQNILISTQQADTSAFRRPAIWSGLNANGCVEARLMETARRELDSPPSALSVLSRARATKDEAGRTILPTLEPCPSCGMNADHINLGYPLECN